MAYIQLLLFSTMMHYCIIDSFLRITPALMQHLATTHMLSSALSMHLPDRQNDSLIIAIPRGYNQVYTHSSVQATSLPHSTHIRLATACRGDSTLSWLHRSILWYWIWIPQCWHQDRYVSDCCHDYVILWIYRVALALLSFGGWASVQQYNCQEERTPH